MEHRVFEVESIIAKGGAGARTRHLVKARYSNMKNRPIGIGCQGLADAFILMRFVRTHQDSAC